MPAILVLALALAAGCGDLNLEDGFPCSVAGKCPSPYTCSAGQCRRAGSRDGAVDASGEGPAQDAGGDMEIGQTDGPPDLASGADGGQDVPAGGGTGGSGAGGVDGTGGAGQGSGGAAGGSGGRAGTGGATGSGGSGAGTGGMAAVGTGGGGSSGGGGGPASGGRNGTGGGEMGSGGSGSGGSCGGTQTLCGGGCVDMATSATNCGACNHSCLGGACGDGLCQPFPLAPAPLAGPERLAVNSTHLFVIGSSTNLVVAYRVPKTGGMLAAISSDTGPLGMGGTPTYALATDDLLVWQSSQGSRGGNRSRITTCAPSVCESTRRDVVANYGGVTLTFDPESSFFYTQLNNDPIVQYMTTTDTAFRSFTSVLFMPVGALTARGGGIAGNLYAVGAEQPAPGPRLGVLARATLDTSPGNARIANHGVDAQAGGPLFVTSTRAVYWAGDPARLFSVALPNGVGDVAPPALAGSTALFSGPDRFGAGPYRYFADDGGIYWVESAGERLVTCPLTGCPAAGPKVLLGSFTGAFGLSGDGAALYWIAADGSIMKMAR